MLRSALFWDIPQRIVVLPCRRFGTTYSPIFKGQEFQRTDCLETAGYVISQKTPTSRRQLRPEIMKSYAVWYIGISGHRSTFSFPSIKGLTRSVTPYITHTSFWRECAAVHPPLYEVEAMSL